MSESSLSFASTASFRNALMSKNLPPYNVQGVYTPPANDVNYETVLNVSNVVDSPGELITTNPYSQQLYPLNEYGPNGGYGTEINFNGPPLPVNSNQGEYNPTDTVLDLVNEFFIDAAYIQNTYGPQGGFNDMVIVTDVENNNKIYSPYWEPPSFAPSSYSPFNILLSPNPVGSNGLLSQDSFIARFGASELNSLLKKRIQAELYQNTLGLINLDSLQDPFEISLILSGQQPLIYKNWKITVPENPVIAAADFATRLGGAYWPVSLIPGDYFNDNNENWQTPQTSEALSTVNQLTGGLLGPILNFNRSGSELFLANTGNGQRSVLFANINYNRYQPPFDKDYGLLFGVAQGLVNLLIPNINPGNGTLVGGYYVGSKTSEPSYITSPPNQVPVTAFGQQDPVPVYGPSEMGIVYEGNETILNNFGLGGKSYTDGGGIDGQFVWTSPKYKPNSGFKSTPGGGSSTIDEDYQLVSGNIERNQSTNIEFKSTSILDQTQRLVNSADNVTGLSRLKHVGNAINQISKVFNDGYKEITKGSQVLSYTDNTTGGEAGIEYCRVFTKDTPYYTYNDLQKSDGITKSGRQFTHSVFDNTYNLNIVPLRGEGSTNIVQNNVNGTGGYAKKYMFSIENLAWRTSSRPGYTYDDLPVCEKGPNGGRVMWFPPYDIKFSDSSTANWSDTPFLGRPEPMYTYKNTSRSGQLTWKIIVDSPSVLNTIVEKQLKGQNKERINSIIDSFFAGCTKYDIYELAAKFNTIPTKDLYTYQEILSNPRLTDEELKEISLSIPRENTTPSNGTETPADAPTEKVNTDTSVSDFVNNYKELSFYFDNDIPDPNSRNTTSSVPYDVTYSRYISSQNIQNYVNKSGAVFNVGDVNRNVSEFFDNIIISSYNKIAVNDSNFIKDLFNLLKEKKGTVNIQMIGSASAVATQSYNLNLSKRRLDSVIQFLKGYKEGGVDLTPFFNDKTLNITLQEGRGEVISIPQSDLPGFNVTGTEVNCTQNVKSVSNTKSDNSIAEVYSTSAMACRRVKIKTIVVEPVVLPPPPPPKVDEIKTPEVENTTINTIKPKQTIEIEQRLKEGISKKIIRQLLTECDYFEVIKESNPMIYGSIADKIKYFNPAFHSMTPEGLNSRLTFLNQCLRPGETIPVIGTDNKPKYNDSVNTAFGSPPVLVLRIGDFYNGKIIPKSLSFTYEPLLDLNPEGIGVQPMIANVSLSFDMIGGMGLVNPVEQLQNALSFNYYANTEIYDERAVMTEDTSALDAKLVQSILDNQPPVTVNNVENGVNNDGGTTIGEIITNIPVPDGQTGEITYREIMDKLLVSTQEYYGNIVNQSESIIKSYNYGMWQLMSQDRLYTFGKLKLISGDITSFIYGKPDKVEEKIDELFNTFIDDINKTDNLNQNFIIKKLFGYKFTETTIQRVKTNMVKYINGLKDDFSCGIFTKTQEIVILEQNMIQLLRKINLINTKTDGKILDTGVPRVYNLTGTDEISLNSEGVSDTADELSKDYDLVGKRLEEFYYYLIYGGIVTTITTPYEIPGGFTPMSKGLQNSTLEDKRMFMVMSQIFNDTNKLSQFINTVISGDLKSDSKLVKKFNNICEDFSSLTKKELIEEDKFIKKIKVTEEYLKFINQPVYPSGKLRKFNYTTVPNQSTDSQQKTDISNLYKTVNINNDNVTFDGKIKFD